MTNITQSNRRSSYIERATPVFPTSTSAQPPIGPLLFKEVLMTTRAKPRATQTKQQLQLTDQMTNITQSNRRSSYIEQFVIDVSYLSVDQR
jgi:hypothetical protein